MTNHLSSDHRVDPEIYEPTEPQDSPPGLSRRDFVQVLGAGLLITVSGEIALAQRRGGRGGGGGFGGRGPANVAARLHIDRDGSITVMTGKVEAGQGSRAEITQAAAEELRLDPARIRLIMADTALTPDDGVTAGSRSTPATVPSVRSGAAAARELLLDLAAQRWKVDRATLRVRDGAIAHEASNRTITYAELAQAEDFAKTLARPIGGNVAVTPVNEWKVLGTSLPRPNRRDIVTGAHRYPSDVIRPGMLYGKILRPPAFGATLVSIDLAPARSMVGVAVMREGSLVGCAAPTGLEAQRAVEALVKTAKWQTKPQVSSKDLFSHLRSSAEGSLAAALEADLARAKTVLHESYEIAYIQHAPMEPRAAVAEWQGDKLTVWTGTQNPFGVRGELAAALDVPGEKVRVIVPDTGGGFGGKHSGEAAVEAARLARAAGRPVCLRWSREEEFTWAYFRPAALIEIRAGLDAAGALVAWDFINVNAGGSGIESPYAIARNKSRSLRADAPLRQGSYRALAATASHFARESFMDELAHAAGADPLAFRLAHLKNDRLRAVLEKAAKEFAWAERRRQPAANLGVGLACGTEKGSYVATCAEVEVDRNSGAIRVRRVCQAFECGAVLNPGNLVAQNQGCVMMGLGGALMEEIRFHDGTILNPHFATYPVPRFKDLPHIDVHLVQRADLAPLGAGETPIVGIAPAVANAVFHATGVRIRSMPIHARALKKV
ncbi:MAG: molybdopterin cofactor-binding domain-containing protein [Thermoguttaceae bacterium]|jgi:isoquinoline 1-oxidoreductase